MAGKGGTGAGCLGLILLAVIYYLVTNYPATCAIVVCSVVAGAIALGVAMQRKVGPFKSEQKKREEKQRKQEERARKMAELEARIADPQSSYAVWDLALKGEEAPKTAAERESLEVERRQKDKAEHLQRSEAERRQKEEARQTREETERVRANSRQKEEAERQQWLEARRRRKEGALALLAVLQRRLVGLEAERRQKEEARQTREEAERAEADGRQKEEAERQRWLEARRRRKEEAAALLAVLRRRLVRLEAERRQEEEAEGRKRTEEAPKAAEERERIQAERLSGIDFSRSGSRPASTENLHDLLIPLRRCLESPAEIRAGRKSGLAGEPIPPLPQRHETGLTLDPTRIEEILRDSRGAGIQIGLVLKDASPTEATEEPGPGDDAGIQTEMNSETVSVLNSLDERYRPFLEGLLRREQQEWHGKDFEQLVREHGLMVSAAIGAINEWAEQVLGDFLIEDGDPVVVNVSLLRKALDEYSR